MSCPCLLSDQGHFVHPSLVKLYSFLSLATSAWGQAYNSNGFMYADLCKSVTVMQLTLKAKLRSCRTSCYRQKKKSRGCKKLKVLSQPDALDHPSRYVLPIHMPRCNKTPTFYCLKAHAWYQRDLVDDLQNSWRNAHQACYRKAKFQISA